MGHAAGYRFIFKENMQIYLEALGESIYRHYGNVTVDILMVGGSALILGHNFRNSTEDIDAYIKSQVDITACIDEITEKYSLPFDWMNTGFTNTESFSVNLLYNAILVGQFKGLKVYKICDLDLFCMKLVSYRPKDKEDLKALLIDMPYLTQDMIGDRLHYLYGPDALYKLKAASIRFVRQNVHR